MLDEIGDVSNIEKFLAKAKDKNDPFKLMGFGHRVYKNFDPRAKVMKKTCDEVLGELGINDPQLELAMKLEEIALKDLLRRTQPVPERRLLFGHHPQGYRHSDEHVHRDLRDVAHCGLDFALEGNDRLRSENRASAPATLAMHNAICRAKHWSQTRRLPAGSLLYKYNHAAQP
ncbi:hypothetical protein SSTU70S_06245 [Stutzerimonas stutzeri]